MNAAKLENSERLSAVYELLRSGKEYSTLQIIKKTGMCAINSIVSELRENNCSIKCTQKMINRKRVWFYRMDA